MRENIICPLCSSSDIIYKFIENNHTLYACNNCSLSFIEPYVQKVEHRNMLSPEKQLKGEESVINSYFTYISEYLEHTDSLLDIGCGCGALLRKAKSMGVKKVVGIEYDEDRADIARKNSGCQILAIGVGDFYTKQLFSTITLINVVSHIPELDTFFYKILPLLKSKGKIIIKTGLMRSGYLQRNIFDWQIPEHIHFFGENTSSYFANKFNLKIIEETNFLQSEDLISKEYMKAPGRSVMINTLKKAVLYFPYGIKIVRFLHNRYTKSKLYTTIVVFEKSE